MLHTHKQAHTHIQIHSFLIVVVVVAIYLSFFLFHFLTLHIPFVLLFCFYFFSLKMLYFQFFVFSYRAIENQIESTKKKYNDILHRCQFTTTNMKTFVPLRGPPTQISSSHKICKTEQKFRAVIQHIISQVSTNSVEPLLCIISFFLSLEN